MKNLTRYSQNFLRDPQIVKSLLSKTNLTANDTVYDIGGGKGIITAALAEKCRTVVSVEIDSGLAAKLRENLKDRHNVLVYEADFLTLPLPQTPYKVFSNIPFNLSADIVRKLTDTPYPPTTSYLIVQKEFAEKFIPKPGGYNSQSATMLGASFETQIVHRLQKANFYPRPGVNSVLLEITPRSQPLVDYGGVQLYRDFVAYVYNACKPSIAAALSSMFSEREFKRVAEFVGFPIDATPTQLSLEQWTQLFKLAQEKGRPLVGLVEGHERELAYRHFKHTKLHRTRF